MGCPQLEVQRQVGIWDPEQHAAEPMDVAGGKLGAKTPKQASACHSLAVWLSEATWLLWASFSSVQWDGRTQPPVFFPAWKSDSMTRNRWKIRIDQENTWGHLLVSWNPALLCNLLIWIIRYIHLSYAGHSKELNFQTICSLFTIFDLVIPLQGVWIKVEILRQRLMYKDEPFILTSKYKKIKITPQMDITKINWHQVFPGGPVTRTLHS